MPARFPLRWLLLVVAVPIAAAAQTMGPNACVTCHDHQPERVWAESKDGPPPNGHIAALKQLESAKAQRHWKQAEPDADVAAAARPAIAAALARRTAPVPALSAGAAISPAAPIAPTATATATSSVDAAELRLLALLDGLLRRGAYTS